MRFKVKTESDQGLDKVLSILAGKVKVFSVSKKRRMLSTDSIPEEYLEEIEKSGGTVSEDHAYSSE